MATTTTLTPLSPRTPSTGGGNPRRIRFSISIQTPPAATQLIFNPTAPHPGHIRRFLNLARDQHDLPLGQSLHAAIIKSHGHHGHTLLLNSLIFTYLKLNLLPDALKVFDEMSFPDIASFTSIISHYGRSGMETDSVNLLTEMRNMDIHPNEFTFVAMATNCIQRFNLHLGFQLHALALKTHHISCTHVSNAFMAVYTKCRQFNHALQLFDELHRRDVSSWNAAMLGMVEDCKYVEAFQLFNGLVRDGKFGDRFSLSTILSAATAGFAGEGEAVHGYAIKICLDMDLSVGNALLSFYTKFGVMEDLLSVFAAMRLKDVISFTAILAGFMEFGLVESAVVFFSQMPEKNHISYNVLLSGFCKNGHGSKGLTFFHQMLEDGAEISDFTLTSLLKACALVSDRNKSEEIHAFIIKSGCKVNPRIEASLIDMCAKCGRMEDARKIFEQGSRLENTSFVSWTTLLHAYALNGQFEEILSLLHRLTEEKKSYASIDEVAFATILGGCGTLGFYKFGCQISSFTIKLGVSSDVGVSNAGISMYAKCGYLKEAVRLFDQMPVTDIVSWNAMINAYLLFRRGDDAMAVWSQMEIRGVKPDAISCLLIISALKYTSSVSIQTCEILFRSMSISHNIEPGAEHYAAMVDALSSSGWFHEAEELIRTMPFPPDASVWRPLLDNCWRKSDHDLGRRAVQRLLAVEPHNAATHVLVANLFAASGRWNCSEKAREEMRAKGMRKNPARSWVSADNGIHHFFCRDRSHPEYRDIHGALGILIMECMKAGYQPDTRFVLQEVEEYQKREFLFYHSAKLAAAYGMIVSRGRETVRAMKNVRLCGDCHEFLKVASSVSCREILFRDSTGFHEFKGGVCSCGDFW
ncbi:Pentatricopeptide repeat-containing protein [Platanthera zijinensis]|uniref:Pentatricopeptide repeat-containing protein n=1 Tax=Platanthera zijinensis TaxID=2320716 RepID=A0AAP0BQ74_9ASPA